MSLSDAYSPIERLLHRVAFAHPMVQKVLKDLEEDLFDSGWKSAALERPVFVAGLPRAGTTLTLDLIFATQEFATYTYREMPFILAPMFWSKMSKPFSGNAELKERAHGDGMTTSVDNPEAFEEVIWQTFAGTRYVAEDRLVPLEATDPGDGFVEALRDAMRKVIALSEAEGGGTQPLRYLSKNNANVSRVELLLKLFPDASVVVLYRNPIAHTRSLMTQHERFCAEHDDDRFSRSYMKWLGHYEFGRDLKPINFDGWMDHEALPDPSTQEFWLRYWVAAYENVLRRKAQIVLVDFDQLLADGPAVLSRLAARLDLADERALIDAASTLRSPTTRALNFEEVAPQTARRAEAIHEALKANSV